jgi:hypothetical protein
MYFCKLPSILFVTFDGCDVRGTESFLIRSCESESICRLGEALKLLAYQFISEEFSS